MKLKHVMVILLFFSSSCFPVQKKERNMHAALGAWASLTVVTALGALAAYDGMYYAFDTLWSYIPFINSEHNRIAMIASRTAIVPLLTLGALRYGKLGWYFFYVFYSGDLISPQLAHDVMNDLRVYVHHLNTIKTVQKQLNTVIDEINAAAEDLKNKKSALDPAVVDALGDIVREEEAYLEGIIEGLLKVIPEDDPELQDIINFLHGVQQVSGQRSWDLVKNTYLEQQAHAVVEHIHAGGEELGYDAHMLNHLVKNLLQYWHDYTVGLAESINLSLYRCHAVRLIEQFVVTVLDRPLSFE